MKRTIFIIVIIAIILYFQYPYVNYVNNSYEIIQYDNPNKSVFENMKFDSEIIIPNTYIKEIHNGILAFNSKKIFGGGLKSHKISCRKYAKYPCAPHPHNYHVEILISAGIVGYLMLLTLFLKFLITCKNSYLEKIKKNRMIFALFGTLFFIEFFPLSFPSMKVSHPSYICSMSGNKVLYVFSFFDF